MYSLLPEYRAANPDARFLAYQKVGGMRADGDDHPSTGVQTGEADSEESWFLHDAEGNRLEYCDYAGVMAANIGEAAYQARWLANVTERLARDGFDGVMMDDVNTFPGHCLGSRGTPLAEYATDEAYGDAVVAFMTAVGPELMDEGFIVAPNIAMNPWNDTMLAQSVAMLPSITHWNREYWMRWDDSENFRGANWQATLQTMILAQDAGRGYLGLTYGPGVEGAGAGQVYGRASWLLAWDGLSDSAWGYKAGLDDPFGPDWGPDIGLPDGPAVAVGGGWMRAYTGGVVLINPSETDDLVFVLDEACLDAEGAETDRVTLDRGQAAVLRSLDSSG